VKHLSLRARLTLIYGGLFMAAGVLLLGLTYALFSQQLSSGQRVIIKGTYLSPPPSGTSKPPAAAERAGRAQQRGRHADRT
jgi:hypothetical protein